MSKQTKIHMVYTIQVKANTSKQLGKDQVNDLVDAVGQTLLDWFPKGNSDVTGFDVTDGKRRVILTDVWPAVQRRAAATKKDEGEEA